MTIKIIACEVMKKELLSIMPILDVEYEFVSMNLHLYPEKLRREIKIDKSEEKLKVVIGVVEGDTHDIGKNLVKIMLETSGFDVIDLGRDVPPSIFVERAKEENANIIAVSTLMTTTMDGMAEVIRILEKQNIREKFKIMIGGGPISQGFADRIGADGYSVNAAEAVRLARKLVTAPM